MENVAENNRQHLAVLGDIRRSRIIGQRGEAQDAFLDMVEAVNAEHGDVLSVPFTVSRGDEFQGLMSEPSSLLAILDAFESRASMFSLRFGLGWGTVATAFRSRTTEMDGPCFLNAYSALERGKKEDRWATFVGASDARARVINGCLRSIQVIRDGWTKKQKAAIAARRTRPTLTATAASLSVDKSTLSKMLKAAHYVSLLEVEESVKLLLSDYLVQPAGGERP